MTTVLLNPSNAVTLDGSGNGRVQLGPVAAGEIWTCSFVHVKTNQKPGTVKSEAQCVIYSGATPDDTAYVDGTLSGSTGDVTDAAAAYPVIVGEYIWAVWTGGDPGVQAVMRITGTKEV